MQIKIELLRNKIKEAYEESVHANNTNVKDILFDCIGLLAGLEAEPATGHPKKHKWDEIDATVAFYLASKYDDTKFRDDPLTVKLLSVRSDLTIGSLQMAIQNFYSLLGKKKGLKSVSNLAKMVFKKYKNASLSRLEGIISELLCKNGVDTVKQREYMKKLVSELGRNEKLVIGAYVKGEKNGEVKRKKDINNMSPENYARALWLDGVAKKWL